jgi:uncharacterized protein
MLLFHGAGGGMDAPVLVTVKDALLAAGVAVARMDHPYRLAGRRAPDPAAKLDAAALAVLPHLPVGLPLFLGGKSSGARVACRTAAQAGARGVVALGFPLHPPGRPDRSRRDELEAAAVPVLVLQGERDAFGRPAEFEPVPAHVTLLPVAGADHALRVFDPEPVVGWVQAALT